MTLRVVVSCERCGTTARCGEFSGWALPIGWIVMKFGKEEVHACSKECAIVLVKVPPVTIEKPGEWQ